MDTTMQMGLMGSEMGDMQQLSKPNGQMGLMGSISSGSLSQQIPMTSQQTQALETVARDHIPQKLSVSNLQMGRMEPQVYSEMSQFFLPNRQSGDLQIMLDNVGMQQSSTLTKRKTPVDLTPNMIPAKRVAQMEHRPWLQQVSVPNKLPVQMQSSPTGSGSQHPHLLSRRPASSKPGGPQPILQKNLSGRMQPSPKLQNESESVRSKLRESLASALSLVSQEQNKNTSDGKNSQIDTGITLEQKLESSQLPAADPTNGSKESISTGVHYSSQSQTGGLNAFQETSVNGGSAGDSVVFLKNSGHVSSSNILLRDEDTAFSDSFFVKDELLQGNGLAWVLEPVAEMAEIKDVEAAGKLQDQHDIVGIGMEQLTETPENLSVKIEAELFKLHGGVNKKYKEKGRSLVFNLKDRNNPELRERVVRGEISPQRLCTMTAEELASKELSEWRMAKAEEMAQMVVLPDSDVDVRRLVKKTHKGEFRVEMEEPDNTSVEVAVGTSSQPLMRPKLKEKEGSSPKSPVQAKENLKFDVKNSGQAKENVKSNVKRSRKAKANANSIVEKSSSEQDTSCTLMIPSSEASDLMQGLMGDDELKDLPPIVSLDEFMESLNSEPPFEILPGDAAKATSDREKGDSLVHSEPNSPIQTAKDCVDTPETDRSVKVGQVETKSDVDDKSAEKNGKSTTKPSTHTSNIDHLWESLLQLSISTTASVIGIFKSGERMSVQEWPSSIEIKGRVRLDAFEKFLQHLPMSRSRAVMAVHLVSKEGSPESERASLSEVAESYVADGRVGLSEPMPGTELYLCPPHSKTREMLGKVLTNDQVDALNDIDSGLIGVVVWRKAQMTSTVSPNSSSHHKHNSKKHQLTTSSRRQHSEKDSNSNVVNKTPRNAPSRAGPPPSIPHKQQPDDDDEAPPGFGPPGGHDEDDLPEFNFSSGAIPLRPQPSMHNPSQIRELIHKYGQPDTSDNWNEKRASGVAHPWDDDDDMPEWNPDEHQRPQQHQQPVHVHGIQQPMLRGHVVPQTRHQQMVPLTMHLQPPVNVAHGPQGATAPWQQGAWMPPPAAHSLAAYQQPGGGQFSGLPDQQGMAWRSDTPRSRGF